MLSICRITACTAIAQTSELLLDLAHVANDASSMSSSGADYGQLRCRVDTRPASAAARRAVADLVGAHVIVYADSVLLVDATGAAPAPGALLPTLCTFGIAGTAARSTALWPHLTVAHVRAAKNASHAYAIAAAQRLTSGSDAVVAPATWADHIRYFTQSQLHPERHQMLAASPEVVQTALAVLSRLCAVAIAVNAVPPWRCGFGILTAPMGFVTWRGRAHDITVLCGRAGLSLLGNYARSDVTIAEFLVTPADDVKPYADALAAAALHLHRPPPSEAVEEPSAAPASPVIGRRARRRHQS